MDKAKVIELENFIFQSRSKVGTAASMISDFVGVMIGVKPVASEYFTAEEFSELDFEHLINLLNQVGLKPLFFKRDYVYMGKLTWIEDVYVSRDIKTILNLREYSEKLRHSMDDIGQIFNQALWEESSREIGKLLGYPDTAIDYFISNQDINDEERQKLVERNRFYVHSPEHEEQEYQAYDRKIYQALSDYAPKTAKLFSENKSKRWLN